VQSVASLLDDLIVFELKGDGALLVKFTYTNPFFVFCFFVLPIQRSMLRDLFDVRTILLFFKLFKQSQFCSILVL